MEPLYKKVNGNRIELSSAEASRVRASWTSADAESKRRDAQERSKKELKLNAKSKLLKLDFSKEEVDALFDN